MAVVAARVQFPDVGDSDAHLLGGTKLALHHGLWGRLRSLSGGSARVCGHILGRHCSGLGFHDGSDEGCGDGAARATESVGSTGFTPALNY